MTEYVYNYEDDDNNNAEMYSHSVSKHKLKQKAKAKTFQQSTRSSSDFVNVGGAAPARMSPTGAAHPGVKDPGKVRYGRELDSKKEMVVEILCQLAKVRSGARNHRMTAYFSIKTDTDNRYMIFMRSSLTTAHDEVMRSITNHKNKTLQQVAEQYIAERSDQGLFLGRIRYKAIKGFVTAQHRKNIRMGLCAVWMQDEGFVGELFLDGEYHEFVFNDDLTQAQRDANYVQQALWEMDEGEI